MELLNNLKVRSKLFILIVFSVLSLIGVMVSSIVLFQRIDAGVGRVYDDHVVPLKLLKSISDNYAVQIIDAVNKAHSDLIYPDEALEGVRRARTEIREQWNRYRGRETGAENAALVRKIDEAMTKADQYLDMVDQTLVAMGDENNGELVQYNGPLYLVIDPISETITELVDLHLDNAKQERRNAALLYNNVRTSYMVGGTIIVLLVSVLGYLLSVSISGPLNRLRRAIETIERNSDVCVQIDLYSKDEVGQTAGALNKMLSKFNGMLSEVTRSTQQLASASDQMSGLADEGSDSVQKQLIETEQVASAINEMTATVQEVARNAARAAEAANTANAKAREGQTVVGQTMSNINALAGEVEKAAGVIQQLETDTESIGMILDVIRGIAEQTNLLALNAAIEAARAGEQGRGFAVVADEVRTLASRTQQSTQEIQQMIQRLQSGASEAVKVMEDGRAQAQHSVEQAGEARTSLKEITSAVDTISDMNVQIAGAAEEQGTVAEEVNRSISNISVIGDQTAQGVKQTASASENLAQLATHLQFLVGQFKV